MCYVLFLQANNAMVRANAASLLFDNFPLVNAEDSEDKDAFLQKQFTAIEELLEDPYTQVRSIGKHHVVFEESMVIQEENS